MTLWNPGATHCDVCGDPLPTPRSPRMKRHAGCKSRGHDARRRADPAWRAAKARREADRRARPQGRRCQWCNTTDDVSRFQSSRECARCAKARERKRCTTCGGPWLRYGCPRCGDTSHLVPVVLLDPDENERTVYRSVKPRHADVEVGGQVIKLVDDEGQRLAPGIPLVVSLPPERWARVQNPGDAWERLQARIEEDKRKREASADCVGDHQRGARLRSPRHPHLELWVHRTSRPDAQGRYQITTFVQDACGGEWTPFGHRYAAHGATLREAVLDAMHSYGAMEVVEVNPPRMNPWEDHVDAATSDRMRPVIRSEAEDLVARARAAGAVPPLRYMGAGAQGAVFCDARGRAYKVGRMLEQLGDMRRRTLREEHDWLRAAGQHPDTAHLVPRVYGFHEAPAVLERECVEGDAPGWRSDHAAWEAELRQVPDWLPPEGGADQWVVTPRGPKIVDGGFARRSGVALVRHVHDLLAGRTPWYDETLPSVAWDVYADATQGRIPPELAALTLRDLRDAGDTSEWTSPHKIAEVLR